MWYKADKAGRQHPHIAEWFAAGGSLDLDTSSKHYGVIENGTLQIKSVNWVRTRGEDDYHVEPGKVICEVKL